MPTNQAYHCVPTAPTTSVYTGAPSPLPRDCQDALRRGCAFDGVHTIDPGCGRPFQVYCDMKNGGWTVFQRRMDGSENFNRDWANYVEGFGNRTGEYWLGLDRLHCLTTRQPRTELRVDLADFFGNYKVAHYSFFNVNGHKSSYTLDVLGYQASSSAPDRLTQHNGIPFTTFDKDNDQHPGLNCARHQSLQGGWWFTKCYHSCLNGVYRGSSGYGSVFWTTLSDETHVQDGMKFAEMKLRARP